MSLVATWVLMQPNVNLELVYKFLAVIVSYGYIPLAHLCVLCAGHAVPGLYPLMVAGCQGSYVIGFVFFWFRLPESRFAGFSLVGSSHQLWHIGVVSGLVFGLWGHLRFYTWRGANPPYC